MPDELDHPEFSPSEIAAMRYAYRILLDEHPERFPDLEDKQELARSVVKSLEHRKPAPVNALAEAVAMIMEEDYT